MNCIGERGQNKLDIEEQTTELGEEQILVDTDGLPSNTIDVEILNVTRTREVVKPSEGDPNVEPPSTTEFQEPFNGTTKGDQRTTLDLLPMFSIFVGINRRWSR